MKIVKAETLKPGDVVMSNQNPAIRGTIVAVRVFHQEAAQTKETCQHGQEANWLGASELERLPIGRNKRKTSTVPPAAKLAKSVAEAEGETFTDHVPASVTIQIGTKQFSVKAGEEISKVA